MDLDAKLRALGYTRAWLDSGVLDAAEVHRQHAAFEVDADQNPEHWRHRTFAAFVAARPGFSDAQLAALVALTDEGPDGDDLRTHRLDELLRSERLTAEQLLDLPRWCPAVQSAPLQRIYRRMVVRLRLRREGAAACFAEVQSAADAEIQLLALADPTLGRDQVVWLAEHGANKQVRHTGRDQLRRRFG
jgi:hypothetical protein